jgi:class 3 adenylate cyclase
VNRLEASNAVELKIVAPDANTLLSEFKMLSDDGSFDHNFTLGGASVSKGEYSVSAGYGNSIVKAKFQLVEMASVDYPAVVHVFFVDIVGLSDPGVATAEEQREKIRVLNECIKNCEAFANVHEDEKYVLPTGDGMAIVYVKALTLPIELAIQLHQRLKEYDGKQPKPKVVKVRIGIHSGPVLSVEDVHGSQNFWGDGIVMARRVMDLGGEDHILLTERTAKDLIGHSNRYKNMLKSIGKYDIKHDQKASVYLAHGPNFGNRKPPKRHKKSSVVSRSIKRRPTNKTLKARRVSGNMQAHYKILTEKSLSKLRYNPKSEGESLVMMSSDFYPVHEEPPYLNQVKSHLRSYDRLWTLYEEGPTLAKELELQSKKLDEIRQEMRSRLELWRESNQLRSFTDNMLNAFASRLSSMLEEEIKWQRQPRRFNAVPTADGREFKVEEFVLGNQNDAERLAEILNQIISDPSIRDKYKTTLEATNLAAKKFNENVSEFYDILRKEVVERTEATNYTKMKGKCKDCPS